MNTVSAGGLNRSFVRDNALVIAGHIVMYLQGFILMPVIIATAGQGVYGGFIVLSALLNVAFGLSSLGVGFKAARMMPSTYDHEERRKLYFPQFVFQLASVVVISVLFLLLDGQIRTHVFKNTLSYAKLVIPLYLIAYVLYSQSSSYFRYTSRPAVMMGAGVVFPILNISSVLAYVAVRDTISVNVLVVSQALAAVAVAMPLLWAVKREVGTQLSFYDRRELASDLRMGFPLVLNFVVDYALAAGDRYIIAIFMTLSAVGEYYPAYAVGSLIILVPKAMSTTLPQLLSRAVDGSHEAQARQMLNYAVKIFLLVALPFVAGCAVLGEPLLALLGNAEIGRSGRLVAPTVALGTLFFGLSMLLSNVLFVRRRTAVIFHMNAIAAALNIGFNVVLLYFFRNLLVAALSMLLSYVVAFAYVNRAIARDWVVEWEPVVVLKSIVAAAVMMAALSGVRRLADGNQGIAIVALEIGIGILVYGVVLLAIGAISSREVAFVKKQVGLRRGT